MSELFLSQQVDFRVFYLPFTLIIFYINYVRLLLLLLLFFFCSAKERKDYAPRQYLARWRRDEMSRLVAFGHNLNQASNNGARRCMHRVRNKVAKNQIIWALYPIYFVKRTKKIGGHRKGKGIQGAKGAKNGERLAGFALFLLFNIVVFFYFPFLSFPYLYLAKEETRPTTDGSTWPDDVLFFCSFLLSF